jgi:prepilin-type N-terminal cleavage/methylation domain-containing protein
MVLERIRRLGDSGFSMIELLVGMALIGILTTIGVPYMNSYYSAMKLRSGADELATLLNAGRYLAIKQNSNVCVAVSGTTVQYQTGVNAVCGGGTVYVGQGTRADGTMPLQNTMELTGATANVVFTNLGAASQGGTYTLRNPVDGHTLTVTVSGSGRITIP